MNTDALSKNYLKNAIKAFCDYLGLKEYPFYIAWSEKKNLVTKNQSSLDTHYNPVTNEAWLHAYEWDSHDREAFNEENVKLDDSIITNDLLSVIFKDAKYQVKIRARDIAKEKREKEDTLNELMAARLNHYFE